MALKIRLRQQGRRNHRTYRLVVIDGNVRREGKYIEAIGWYDPNTSNDDTALSIKADRAQHWLDNGAQLSERAEALLVRAAPAIVKQYHAKQSEKAVKATAKKRESRRAKATEQK